MEKYFLLSANTNSDWDGVAFALVHFTPEFVRQCIDRIEIVQKLHAKDKGIFSLTCYDVDVSFHNNEDELPNPKVIKKPSIIELAESQIEEFAKPENAMESATMSVSLSSVKFKAFGKHSGEEFWTDDIDLSYLRLLDDLNKIEKNKLCTTVEKKRYFEMFASDDEETQILLKGLIKAQLKKKKV